MAYNLHDPNSVIPTSLDQDTDERILKICPHCSNFNSQRESVLGQPGINQFSAFVNSRQPSKENNLLSSLPPFSRARNTMSLASLPRSESSNGIPESTEFSEVEPLISAQTPDFASRYIESLVGQPSTFQQLPYKVSGDIEVTTPTKTETSHQPSVAIRFLQVRSATQIYGDVFKSRSICQTKQVNLSDA